MSTAARTAVDPAAIIPPRVGLLATARETNRLSESVDTAGARWEAGFRTAPEGTCPPAQVAPSDTCDTGAAYPHKNIPSQAGILDFEPYGVYGTDKCSNADQHRDRVGRATRNLAAGLSAAVAKELWRGDIAATYALPNPSLANSAAIITGGAVTPLQAMAALEQVYRDAGGVTQAVVHATKAVMDYWRNLQLVERVGNIFLTVNDSLVVADAGYDGSSPTGVAAATGAVWAYITPGVQVRLGPVMDPLISRRTVGVPADNLTEVRVERLVAATFESPCALTFAVAVNIPVYVHA